ncbi:MAG: hypothetical protein U0T73_06885 [Chitinophagales bacterium]
MKHLFCCCAMALLPFLMSCNGKKHAEQHFHSSDEKVKIDLIGNREMANDPLITQIHLHAYDMPDQVFEIQLLVSDLTSDNVHMDWTDNQHSKLSISLPDGDKKVFDITALPNQATVVPVVNE